MEARKASVTRCPQCRRRLTRNSEQNRLLWALYHLVAEKMSAAGHAHSAETWHRYFASKFLGCEDVILPGGKQLVIPHSTAGLDVAEFAAYFDQVQAWAAERNIYLEDTVWAA